MELGLDEEVKRGEMRGKGLLMKKMTGETLKIKKIYIIRQIK